MWLFQVFWGILTQIKSALRWIVLNHWHSPRDLHGAAVSVSFTQIPHEELQSLLGPVLISVVRASLLPSEYYYKLIIAEVRVSRNVYVTELSLVCGWGFGIFQASHLFLFPTFSRTNWHLHGWSGLGDKPRWISARGARGEVKSPSLEPPAGDWRSSGIETLFSESAVKLPTE